MCSIPQLVMVPFICYSMLWSLGHGDTYGAWPYNLVHVQPTSGQMVLETLKFECHIIFIVMNYSSFGIFLTIKKCKTHSCLASHIFKGNQAIAVSHIHLLSSKLILEKHNSPHQISNANFHVIDHSFEYFYPERVISKTEPWQPMSDPQILWKFYRFTKSKVLETLLQTFPSREFQKHWLPVNAQLAYKDELVLLFDFAL